ncbi:hypothetical protein C0Q70_10644 [Pomacea canaliculata]|uniref:Uncharacterized protein n=1 Tax=Pomacea canaliculata TaxID=400727 RepID=A0A2T7P3T5_POMCA|nr:hypothetical protein C0Q70_10644 [Pomacea canaliculata]
MIARQSERFEAVQALAGNQKPLTASTTVWAHKFAGLCAWKSMYCTAGTVRRTYAEDVRKQSSVPTLTGKRQWTREQRGKFREIPSLVVPTPQFVRSLVAGMGTALPPAHFGIIYVLGLVTSGIQPFLVAEHEEHQGCATTVAPHTVLVAKQQQR